MEIKTKCIVLCASPYSIVDERSGEKNEGISIHYLTTDNLNPTAENDNGMKGLKPCKEAIKLGQKSKIVSVPGLYEFDFSFATNAAGKPQMKLQDLKFLNDINFAETKAVSK